MSSYFIALKLSPEMQQQLVRLCQSFPSTREEQEDDPFHLILRHLGPLSDQALYEVKERLASITCLPFQMRLQGLEATFNKANHGTVWVHVVPSEPVIKLKREVDRLLNGLKLPSGEKSFKPTVTLIKNMILNPNKVADFLAYHYGYQSPSLAIDELSLFQYQVTPKKIIYQVIENYSLKLI